MAKAMTMKSAGSDVKLKATGLSKSFGRKKVLDNISFELKSGEIFGLLGPNGAGKTTMIRIILDILGRDSGEVSIFGSAIASEDVKERIGYLPEEGSLYRDSMVDEVIAYFAELKGVRPNEAMISGLLTKFGLIEDRKKKVSELSKGMQRKVLFIISVIHNPEILILDEPFSGLDPINRKLVKDFIMEMKAKGMTIIMSTHEMDEVERMCDRIMMINKGRKVLYGKLDEIKKEYGYSVFVDYKGRLPRLAEASSVNDYGNHAEISLKKGAATQPLLKKLASKVEIRKFDIKTRSLDEIFIDVVKHDRKQDAGSGQV